MLVVTACSSGSTSGSTASGGKTLTIFDWSSLSNPGDKALLQEYKKQTGVTVQVVQAAQMNGDPQPWIASVMTGGTAPDIMTMGTTQEPWTDIKKGWWLNLAPYAMAPDPYVPGNKHWIDLLAPGAANALWFAPGRMYAMTTSGSDLGFFYNKDIFAKAGIARPPVTWTELISDLSKIKAAGYIPLEFELGSIDYAGQAPSFLTMLEGQLMSSTIPKMNTSNSGVVTVQEWVDAIRNGTFSTRNPDYQEAWRLIKQLSQYFQLGAAGTVGNDAGLNAFESGRVGMWFEGSWNAESLAGTKVHWGDFLMPRITSETSRYAFPLSQQPLGVWGACCGYPWAIPATTKKNGHLKMALDFLYWLSQPKIAARFDALAGVTDVQKAAPPNPLTKIFQQSSTRTSAVTSAELAMPPSYWATRMHILQSYIAGTTSLSTAMSEMQTELVKDANTAAREYNLK
jgi:ABC-type glycerol-3-phosphate transport system substrate-binding protein